MARKSRKHGSQTTSLEAAAPNKYTTWGYARISSDSVKSGESIENQVALIKDYASDKGGLDMQNIATDYGFSGTDFQRPAFLELLDGIKRGDVQCLVVKDLSRLGRAYIEVGELLFDTFPTHNVRFISISDNYDSFADDAARKKLMILFKNLVNHMYSKDLGEKIRASHIPMYQRGTMLGALPPFGYIFTKIGDCKRLKIEPEAAATVKMMYDMRHEGKSLAKIANFLNQNGILMPRNHLYRLGYIKNEADAVRRVWTSGHVGKILRNEVYLGILAQNKREKRGRNDKQLPRSEWIIHENAHSAIVSKEQFYAVQQLIDAEGQKRKKKNVGIRDENIYIGKLFCSRCGKAMARNYSHTREAGNRYRILCPLCGKELRFLLDSIKMPTLWLDKMEEILIVVLQKQIDACISIEELITEAAKSKAVVSKHQSYRVEVERLQRESKKADDMLATAYTHHLAGILDSHDFGLAREKFERDKNAAEARMSQLSDESAKFDIEKAKQNAYLANFRRFKGFTTLNRELVATLIHRIEIEPLTKEIHVKLNFMSELEDLNELIEEGGVLSDVCQ